METVFFQIIIHVTETSHLISCVNVALGPGQEGSDRLGTLHEWKKKLHAVGSIQLP